MQVVFKHKQLLHGNAVGKNNSEKKLKTKPWVWSKNLSCPDSQGSIGREEKPQIQTDSGISIARVPTNTLVLGEEKWDQATQSKAVGIARESMAEGYGSQKAASSFSVRTLPG